MLRRLISPTEFAREVRSGQSVDASIFRLAEADFSNLSEASSRSIPYILSTGGVARDGHTVDPAGWKLDAYRSNPVVLWCHSGAEPPVGQMSEISITNGALRGVVTYADEGQYAFADTVFRLVKGGFIRAVSVSWDPIRWKYSTDKGRQGGIDFLEQELLEVSQVPVPSDVRALATARRAGIDTGPILKWAERLLDLGETTVISRAELENLRREAKMPSSNMRAAATWKVGAKRGLKVNTTQSWDGPSAEKRIFAAAGFDGDTPDPAKARGAFLFYDASAPEMKGSYKEPFADIIDGELTAVRAGLDAAASRLDATDVPDDVKADAKAVLESYKSDDSRAAALVPFVPKPRAGGAAVRGLYEVAWLAQSIAELDYLQWCVQMEAEYEGDGSTLPAKLLAILKDAGAALVAMTQEEVDEMIAERPALDVDVMADDEGLRGAAAICAAVRSLVRRAVAPEAARLRAASVKDMDAETMARLLRNDMLSPQGRMALADMILSRSGKVISGANETDLRSACDHMRSAHDSVRGVIAQNYPDDADPLAAIDDPPAATDDSGEARALRERRAMALALAV
jgi:hypothetical protein